ncbi:hypothetical protein BKA67DRAFT_649391 [Truncatella angustata]|uniref:Uncharacterized protein n=1 Tax=Truncatella angustata TaxID=152316 RepID=A0A9P8RPA4_9PEZI|nr:uncharacterized protein BKA67DRAFT_649391 [Truncatella angustata]KAH6647673.1 hypothetical protein BKA67DRAFT_649391 [Truncatella angustata]KAH8195895.1 hypothetical protein TruAng_009941 [Truncatella angustata]
MTSAFRSSLRAARQLNSATRPRYIRTYSSGTNKPPMSQGGSNRNIIIALVGLSIPTALLWRSQNKTAAAQPVPEDYPTPASPNLEPADRVRVGKERAEARNGQVKYEHPEDREPERFKPAFGRLHEKKRVDGPPHGRNHQELEDRQRTTDKP